jgi:hypothetical protein
MGDDMKTLGDGLRDLTNTVNNLVTKFDDLAVTVRNMGGKVDRLAPLAPIAAKLAALPEKVVTLQSSAFENTEQLRALNLALIHVEVAQRDGKAPVDPGPRDGKEHVDETDPDDMAKSVPKPPQRVEKPPPRDYYREEEDDYNDT